MNESSAITDLTSSRDVTVQLENGSVIVFEDKATPARERADFERQIETLLEGLNEVHWQKARRSVVVAPLAPGVSDQVRQFARLAALDKQMTERLVSAMFTQNTASPAAVQQARRNAEARQELIDEFGLFDSEGLAELVGSTAKNRSATASRWLSERRVFAVEHLSHRYFPAFQFGADSRPRPIIQRVLEAFEPFGLDGWEIALWFATATGWLDDQRPVDRLAAAPDDVVMCAKHTFDEVSA